MATYDVRDGPDELEGRTPALRETSAAAKRGDARPFRVGGKTSVVGPRPLQPLAAQAIARRSSRLARLFGLFCAFDLASFFHRVRLLGELPRVDGPLIFVTNHPSWWDAELFGWLATAAYPERRGYAPMDAVNLERYSVLTRFGAFPLKLGTFAGGRFFLAAAERALHDPDGLLFVTIEGRFRDVRVRPLCPMPGLAHLARRVPTATFVPLAIDYVFWSERRPNMLLNCGAPISAVELAAMTTEAATGHLADALEGTMSALSDAGQSRDPARFKTLLKGRDGMNIVFDLWRRAKAFAKGQRFSAAHRQEP